MKELSKLQKTMLDNWIKDAEKEIKPAEVQFLDAGLSGIIKSIEYEKPLSYYKRLELK